jgi:hypothetical protein
LRFLESAWASEEAVLEVEVSPERAAWAEWVVSVVVSAGREVWGVVSQAVSSVRVGSVEASPGSRVASAEAYLARRV